MMWYDYLIVMIRILPSTKYQLHCSYVAQERCGNGLPPSRTPAHDRDLPNPCPAHWSRRGLEGLAQQGHLSSRRNIPGGEIVSVSISFSASGC